MIKTDFMSNVRNFKKELEKNKEKSDKIEKEKVDSKNEFQRLLEESKTPRPLGIDEVAASFISMYRVSSWENLGDNFGGYKVGRILAYILGVLNEKIEESTAATIRVDVPLYEQCPTVPLKEKVYEKCPLKDSEFYGKTVKELMNNLAEKIEHSCDYLDKNKKVEESEEKYCMYCKEKDGTINHDIFIQISDEELGVGWVCKKCFLESEEEKDELMYTQQQNIINKNNVLNRIKEIAKEPFEIDGNPAFLQVKAQNRFRDILTLVKKGLEEE